MTYPIKNLLDLPQEMLVSILIYLELYEITAVGTVAKKLHEITNKPFLWFKFLHILAKKDLHAFNANLTYKRLSFFYQPEGKNFKEKGLQKNKIMRGVYSAFIHGSNRYQLASYINSTMKPSRSVINVLFDDNNICVLIEKIVGDKYVLCEFGLKSTLKAHNNAEKGFIPFLKNIEISAAKIKELIKTGVFFNLEISLIGVNVLEKIIKNDLTNDLVFCPKVSMTRLEILYQYLFAAIENISEVELGKADLLECLNTMQNKFAMAKKISNQSVLDVLTDEPLTPIPQFRNCIHRR